MQSTTQDVLAPLVRGDVRHGQSIWHLSDDELTVTRTGPIVAVHDFGTQLLLRDTAGNVYGADHCYEHEAQAREELHGRAFHAQQAAIRRLAVANRALRGADAPTDPPSTSP